MEIALSDSENGIYQKDIAKNQNISYKYLDHIITALKVVTFLPGNPKKLPLTIYTMLLSLVFAWLIVFQTATTANAKEPAPPKDFGDN